MRFGFGWRIEGIREIRREFARLRRESSSPLLICANHLTMVDSFLIAHALASPWRLVVDYGSVPWNTPERENFGKTALMRSLVYIMKCVPVTRGGNRQEVGRTLMSLIYLLSRGEVGLIFPEGGRTRTGRIDVQATTYGAGRIVKSLPGCRVLCVYLRGEKQGGYSDVPIRRQRFRVTLDSFEPKADRGGLRGSVEITRQILARLGDMEQRYFDDRE